MRGLEAGARHENCSGFRLSSMQKTTLMPDRLEIKGMTSVMEGKSAVRIRQSIDDRSCCFKREVAKRRDGASQRCSDPQHHNHAFDL